MNYTYLLQFVIALFFCGATHIATAQKTFPDTEVNLVDGTTITLPKADANKPTIIAVAYSRKSDDALNSWYKPMYRTFIDPPKGGFIPAFQYDVDLYFVGLLGGLKKAASGTIQSSMNKKMDARFHKRAGLSPVPLKEYKKSLKLDRKDQPVFFVLNSAGQIVYRTEGFYSKTKMAEITAAVDKLAK